MYVPYGSNYMTSWTANYGDCKTNSDAKHLGGGMHRQSTAEFWGGETVLWGSTMVGARHCTFVRAHRTSATRREPSGKLWTWGCRDMSVQVYSYNTCSALVQMSITGEVMYTCHGRGYMGKLLTFHSVLL